MILDGAMGTMVHQLALDEAGFRGERFAGLHRDLKNCIDVLPLTQPDAIRAIHAAYFAAGSDIVETCTFGTTSVALADFGLQKHTRELNLAAARLAREAAMAAEAAGVQMLTIHGRTREQGYSGFAEHDTVAHIKSRVAIPVVANGDVNSPQAARDTLARTGADAVMVGRAAQGRPWIFREIAHFLATGAELAPPTRTELKTWMLAHLLEHYELYGENTGVRSARKHLGWYAQSFAHPAEDGARAFRQRINTATTCDTQLAAVTDFFDEWDALGDWTAAPEQATLKLAA